MHVCKYIYGLASKFGYGSPCGTVDVWIGLGAFGVRMWIGALHVRLVATYICLYIDTYIHLCMYIYIYYHIYINTDGSVPIMHRVVANLCSAFKFKDNRPAAACSFIVPVEKKYIYIYIFNLKYGKIMIKVM